MVTITLNQAQRTYPSNHRSIHTITNSIQNMSGIEIAPIVMSILPCALAMLALAQDTSSSLKNSRHNRESLLSSNASLFVSPPPPPHRRRRQRHQRRVGAPEELSVEEENVEVFEVTIPQEMALRLDATLSNLQDIDDNVPQPSQKTHPSPHRRLRRGSE